MDRLSFSALKLRQQVLSFFVYCLNVKMDPLSKSKLFLSLF